MNGKILTSLIVAAALGIGGIGTAWLAGVGPFARPVDPAAKSARQISAQNGPVSPNTRFVSLDKLIVMLRAPESTRSHYLVLDLVFPTDVKRERQVKDQLPLLRSTAYHALSNYTVEEARGMDVDQLVSVLQNAYAEIYGGADAVPFSGVLIGKQIFE